MNRTMKIITISAALAALVAIGSGCILEDTGIEIVIKDSYCLSFAEDEDSETFTTPSTIDLAEELDEALEDNDVDPDQVVRASMIIATYQVTDPPAHDWTLSGQITVRRTDVAEGPVVIVDYASQALSDCTAEPVYATLNQAGVDLVNDAIDDYLGGVMRPVLEFSVENGDCSPSPSETDRLIFTWEACVLYYAVVADTLSVPDPFPGSDSE
jgi:hypothetical protein